MKLKITLILISCCNLLILQGCAYQTSVEVSPAYDVYSNYDNKIPGNWALYIDADEFGPQDFSFEGLNCAAHKYPMDISGSFNQSVLRTIENVVENVRIVETPLTLEGLVQEHIYGQITIRAEEIDVEMNVIPGFWSADVKADVDLTISATVDGDDGRLFGTTVSEDADEKKAAGGFCEGGSAALGAAAANAMEKTLERLAERISNSSRLRETSNDSASTNNTEK